jgi:hypothetical protein
MPFKKGESGNPGGRPKAASGLRSELERRYGNDAKKLLDQLDRLMKSKNERTQLDAVKLALAYHVGQPTQRIETTEDQLRVPQSVQFVFRRQPDSCNRT